ncbi:DUF4249 domain-containing protein [Reichenbachiella sp.]|uniref:DUF4249 domain-containing protein n=1 Tax=Reichenbachiella sp. TaxID=2184521 RepID=UPI003B5B10A0
MKGAIKILSLIIALLCNISCVEDFKFDVPSDVKGIVVEGYISNLSYSDQLAYPKDPAIFELGLRYTSDVTNVRDEPVLGAQIELHGSSGEVYDYAEIGEGRYGLFYGEVKALPGLEYQIIITLEDGTEIYSEMTGLPESSPVGDLFIEEASQSVYEYRRDELVISEKNGINLNIKTAPNNSGSPYYYKWDFITTFIKTAFLAGDNSPFRYCWTSSIYYYKDYKLLEDLKGNAPSSLFFLDTNNSRLNEGFSVMIRQMKMPKGYYQFMKDLQVQGEQSELFAKPPFNLVSNLHSDEINVFGYFGVVQEDYKRWYFDKDEVSNYGGYKKGCVFDDVPPPYPASCFNCLQYSYDGPVSNEAPIWWDSRYSPK